MLLLLLEEKLLLLLIWVKLITCVGWLLKEIVNYLLATEFSSLYLSYLLALG
jgi:hypothetical protein